MYVHQTVHPITTTMPVELCYEIGHAIILNNILCANDTCPQELTSLINSHSALGAASGLPKLLDTDTTRQLVVEAIDKFVKAHPLYPAVKWVLDNEVRRLSCACINRGLKVLNVTENSVDVEDIGIEARHTLSGQGGWLISGLTFSCKIVNRMSSAKNPSKPC